MSVTREHLRILSELRKSMAFQRIGFTYLGVEELLVRHGTHYTAIASEFVLPKRYHAFPSQCFDNAYRLARKSTRLRYVEGFAMSVMPLHHAWCVTDDDRIVDPTWTDDTWSLLQTTRPVDYVGVPISLATAGRIRNNHCVSILDNWIAGWPMLRDPYDVERESARW